MTTDSAVTYEFTITPMVDGWRLRLLKNGEDVGGGIFPTGHRGYRDAREAADAWLFTKHAKGTA